MSGCGASPERVVTGDWSITGTVTVDDTPRAGAYVRLLNDSGEFVAETPTSTTGRFAFFAAPGEWTVRLLLPGRAVDEAAVLTDPAGTTVAFTV